MEQIAAWIRNHWHIENRLHYVRDLTYDEDRSRVSGRDLPRNLAALTNTAISIIRGLGRFAFVPEANRHFAARSHEALDLLLHPPGYPCGRWASVARGALRGVTPPLRRGVRGDGCRPQRLSARQAADWPIGPG